jgi:hypothetical protein
MQHQNTYKFCQVLVAYKNIKSFSYAQSTDRCHKHSELGTDTVQSKM